MCTDDVCTDRGKSVFGAVFCLFLFCSLPCLVYLGHFSVSFFCYSAVAITQPFGFGIHSYLYTFLVVQLASDSMLYPLPRQPFHPSLLSHILLTITSPSGSQKLTKILQLAYQRCSSIPRMPFQSTVCPAPSLHTCYLSTTPAAAGTGVWSSHPYQSPMLTSPISTTATPNIKSISIENTLHAATQLGPSIIPEPAAASPLRAHPHPLHRLETQAQITAHEYYNPMLTLLEMKFVFQ